MLQAIGLSKVFSEPARSLRDIFNKEARRFYALRDVSVQIGEEEVLGIVGESGCGKSTLARTVARIYTPDKGRIIFMGKDITHLNNRELFDARRRMQIIFQNPYSSLNPRRRVSDIIGDPLRLHGLYEESAISEALRAVGLDETYAKRYPHQLSGGERQRVAIARALALRPSLMIADEITSSLDVSTQMRILELLKRIKNEYRLSMMFISHDLAVVNYMSDRVAVMYAGEIVEEGPSHEIINNPLHPYTQALIESVPDPRKGWRPRVKEVEGDHVSPGCRFAPRCPYAFEKCYAMRPTLTQYNNSRKVACFLHQ
ncbi:MAG: ABC transporter ATP-binding protein [Candidatus Caldarchaeum sp.]|jgi:oligopeptide/dipeptide ABC transporter ATP-binding protein|nr:ABC transporter ATP-binding protein [Candidatus Caldarchaeales archaeon]